MTEIQLNHEQERSHMTPERLTEIRRVLKSVRAKVSYVFIARDLLAELDAVTRELDEAQGEELPNDQPDGVTHERSCLCANESAHVCLLLRTSAGEVVKGQRCECECHRDATARRALTAALSSDAAASNAEASKPKQVHWDVDAVERAAVVIGDLRLTHWTSEDIARRVLETALGGYAGGDGRDPEGGDLGVRDPAEG